MNDKEKLNIPSEPKQRAEFLKKREEALKKVKPLKKKITEQGFVVEKEMFGEQEREAEKEAEKELLS